MAKIYRGLYAIGRPKRRGNSALTKAYSVYSKRYDRVVDAAQLDSVLGTIPSKYRASYDEACEALEHGLAGWRAKLDLSCVEAGRRISSVIPKDERQETVVTLLIDHSGSMSGQRIMLAAATTMCVTDWLTSLGVKVEVLGFTTASWKGGRPRKIWRWFPKPKPGRLCETLHIIYRKAGETTPGMPWSLRSMLRADLPKENVDGEALEWAVERLRKTKAMRRFLVVLSDGAPVDDSTISANGNNFLPDHLKSVVQDIEAAGDILVGAVDISSGHCSEFYRNVVKTESVDELGSSTVSLIEKMILGNR